MAWTCSFCLLASAAACIALRSAAACSCLVTNAASDASAAANLSSYLITTAAIAASWSAVASAVRGLDSPAFALAAAAVAALDAFRLSLDALVAEAAASSAASASSFALATSAAVLSAASSSSSNRAAASAAAFSVEMRPVISDCACFSARSFAAIISDSCSGVGVNAASERRAWCVTALRLPILILLFSGMSSQLSGMQYSSKSASQICSQMLIASFRFCAIARSSSGMLLADTAHFRGSAFPNSSSL